MMVLGSVLGGVLDVWLWRCWLCLCVGCVAVAGAELVCGCGGSTMFPSSIKNECFRPAKPTLAKPKQHHNVKEVEEEEAMADDSGGLSSNNKVTGQEEEATTTPFPDRVNYYNIDEIMMDEEIVSVVFQKAASVVGLLDPSTETNIVSSVGEVRVEYYRVDILALAHPYFEGLAKVEREPSSKMEFEFERRRVTKEDIRELIFWEILEYHPQVLKE